MLLGTSSFVSKCVELETNAVSVHESTMNQTKSFPGCQCTCCGQIDACCLSSSLWVYASQKQGLMCCKSSERQMACSFLVLACRPDCCKVLPRGLCRVNNGRKPFGQVIRHVSSMRELFTFGKWTWLFSSGWLPKLGTWHTISINLYHTMTCLRALHCRMAAAPLTLR